MESRDTFLGFSEMYQYSCAKHPISILPGVLSFIFRVTVLSNLSFTIEHCDDAKPKLYTCILILHLGVLISIDVPITHHTVFSSTNVFFSKKLVEKNNVFPKLPFILQHRSNRNSVKNLVMKLKNKWLVTTFIVSVLMNFSSSHDSKVLSDFTFNLLRSLPVFGYIFLLNQLFL